MRDTLTRSKLHVFYLNDYLTVKHGEQINGTFALKQRILEYFIFSPILVDKLKVKFGKNTLFN